MTNLFFIKTPLLLLSGGTSTTLTEFAVDQLSGVLLDKLQEDGAINMETNMLASVIIGMVGSKTLDLDQLKKLIEDVKRLSNKVKPQDLKKLVADIVEQWKTGAKKGVKGVGKFTLKQIDDYVAFATKNKNATKVMLGKYLDGGPNSYIQRAGTDHTYFDLGTTKWREAEALVNKNTEEMWKINKQFIDEQKALNKEFYFSQEPWKAQTHEYLSKEAEYLIDLGAKDFLKINDDTWKVIW